MSVDYIIHANFLYGTCPLFVCRVFLASKAGEGMIFKRKIKAMNFIFWIKLTFNGVGGCAVLNINIALDSVAVNFRMKIKRRTFRF